MFKRYLLLVFICMICLSLFGQQTALKTFRLDGTVNVDTGTIQLNFVADSSYYPAGVHQLSTKIINHKFTFEGSIPYPIGFELNYKNQYVSSMFLVEPGVQTLTCNTDSSRKTPQVQNKVMQEYYNKYLPGVSSLMIKNTKIDLLRDSLNNIFGRGAWPENYKILYSQMTNLSYAESDKALLTYIQSNPDSYLGLWKLTQLFKFGFEPVFKEMCKAFSPAIKSTYTGKFLDNKITSAASFIAVGKAFPDVQSTTADQKKFTPGLFSNNRFTLVDFWYSHCMPCIGQFSDLKAIYQQYHSDGFEIAGISTDQLKYRADWLRVIKANNLPWPQYWDKNGAEAARLSISAFPTNFLVNDKGIIIAKNLTPVQVKQFLKENLKQRL